jgi:hypothetical protein
VRDIWYNGGGVKASAEEKGNTPVKGYDTTAIDSALYLPYVKSGASALSDSLHSRTAHQHYLDEPLTSHLDDGKHQPELVNGK